MATPPVPTLALQHVRTVADGLLYLACPMGDDFLLLGGDTGGGTALEYLLVSGTDLSIIGSGSLTVASGGDAYADWPPITNAEQNGDYITNMVPLDDTHVVAAILIDKTAVTTFDAKLFVLERSGSSVSIASTTTAGAAIPGIVNGTHFRIAKTSSSGFTCVWMSSSDHIQATTWTFSGASLTLAHTGTPWAISSDDESAEVPHYLDQFTGLPDGTAWLYSTYTLYKITSGGNLDSQHIGVFQMSELVGTSSGRVYIRKGSSWRRAYTDVSTFDNTASTGDDTDTMSGGNGAIFGGDNGVFEAESSSSTMRVRYVDIASTGGPTPGPSLHTDAANNTELTSLAVRASDKAVLAVTLPSGTDLEMFLYGVAAPVENIDTGPLNNSRIRFAG